MKWLITLAALFVALPLYALEPGEALSDPAQEVRARVLMAELRCMVCQNETIEASRAPFAAEVRTLVREQVAAGRTDNEIKNYLSSRYGDAILFRPRLGLSTWALWLGPFMLLGLGAIVVVVSIRSAREKPSETPLSTEEQKQLNNLLGTGGDPKQ